MRVCMHRRPKTGLLYLISSGLLWGTGGLTGTLLGRAAWTRIAVIGSLAAAYQSCYFMAVSLTSVALATLVTIGTAPVIVLAVERITGRRNGCLAALAAGLALTGLGLLVGLPSGFSATRVLAGAGLAVLAAGGFAAITLTGTRPVRGLDELTVTGFGFTFGGLALVPVAGTFGGLSFRPGLEAFGLLVALGTGPTAIAYTLYFRGLRTAAASTATLLNLLEPLTGAVLAAIILGQRLTATGIAGAIVLLTAVALTVVDAGPGEGRTRGAAAVGKRPIRLRGRGLRVSTEPRDALVRTCGADPSTEID